MKYVVVVGNMARIFGPFNSLAEAQAYVERFDIMSFNYNSGRFEHYSVTIVALSAP